MIPRGLWGNIRGTSERRWRELGRQGKERRGMLEVPGSTVGNADGQGERPAVLLWEYLLGGKAHGSSLGTLHLGHSGLDMA